MKITSKNGEELNFLETGVDGIYVLDRIAFMDYFDDNNNDWEKSAGKKKLQKWAEQNLPKEILDQFDVDLPTIGEVFSKRTLKWWKPAIKPTSKQFPIFKKIKNRIRKFKGGNPTLWWTRSTDIGIDYLAWIVDLCGGMNRDYTGNPNGFVPVLRRKK